MQDIVYYAAERWFEINGIHLLTCGCHCEKSTELTKLQLLNQQERAIRKDFFTVNSIGGVRALRISAYVSITVHFRYTGHRLSFCFLILTVKWSHFFSPKSRFIPFQLFHLLFLIPKSLCCSVQGCPVSFLIMFSGTLIQSNPCFLQPTCTINKLRSPCFSPLTNIYTKMISEI